MNVWSFLVVGKLEDLGAESQFLGGDKTLPLTRINSPWLVRIPKYSIIAPLCIVKQVYLELGYLDMKCWQVYRELGYLDIKC